MRVTHVRTAWGKPSDGGCSYSGEQESPPDPTAGWDALCTATVSNVDWSRHFVARLERATKKTGAEEITEIASSGTLSEREQAARVARRVIARLIQRIDGDIEMKKDYFHLLFFLGFVGLFMFVVGLQRIGGGNNQLTFATMKSQLFQLTNETAPTASTITTQLDDIDSWWAFVEESVIRTIFIDSACGDGVCGGAASASSVEPEEFPFFQAASDAREFPGCRADCGSAEVTPVVVDFFDPWKLWYALREVDDAFVNGIDGASAEAYGVSDGDGNVLRPPAAGWNVCSRSDNELGHFEHVSQNLGGSAVEVVV